MLLRTLRKHSFYINRGTTLGMLIVILAGNSASPLHTGIIAVAILCSVLYFAYERATKHFHLAFYNYIVTAVVIATLITRELLEFLAV